MTQSSYKPILRLNMVSVVYVDGENHFLRTEKVFKMQREEHTSLERAWKNRTVVGAAAYPDESEPIVEADRSFFFFWDKQVLDYLEKTLPRVVGRGVRNVMRGVYATSCYGDVETVHQARVWIRKKGFDPLVVHELRGAREQRENRVQKKAKTVDLALAVRILEDAYHDAYDVCYLFSSDLDFVPIVEAVKRLGKRVIVCGYRDALGVHSDLEFVPDAFVDLTARVETYSWKRENPE